MLGKVPAKLSQAHNQYWRPSSSVLIYSRYLTTRNHLETLLLPLTFTCRKLTDIGFNRRMQLPWRVLRIESVLIIIIWKPVKNKTESSTTIVWSQNQTLFYLINSLSIVDNNIGRHNKMKWRNTQFSGNIIL